ncbi:hypothetical protein BKA70DRAFT_1287500 [Coprinopsis sp. MPI-PUGE-AT-0042]|nr:hypothetical protein BKA70DRAFT_1287500 [Coprinopsis sp. MPI-PUGE-AT-0042]
MGAANSKATATAGPGLTVSEKIDADGASLETWLKQFEDLNNPLRRKVVDLVSSAVYASEGTSSHFDYIQPRLLEICKYDHQRREKLVQTPFLNGETLITWTICHLPERHLLDTPFEVIPPVLSVQLGCIESWRTDATVTDAMSVACCTRNANRLFQLFNPYRKSSIGAVVYKLAGGAISTTFQFTINDFPTLMLVEGRVDLRFICESRLYSVGFLIGKKGEWSFFYHVVHDRSGEKSYRRTVHVDLERSSEHSLLY